MNNLNFSDALNILDREFKTFDWKYIGNIKDKIHAWPGPSEHDIMICVHNGKGIDEIFHRQDFFFINYAYKNKFEALSYKFDNKITINENECYIGQPFTGYAIHGYYENEVTIIGVLIKKESFFKTFISALASEPQLFKFFLSPQINKYSDEFIHLPLEENTPIKTLLELMVIEYAEKKDDCQKILKPMVLTLLMQIARRYKKLHPISNDLSISDKMIHFMNEHSDNITLADLGKEFSYHPTYISNLLKEETGRTFSEILLEIRMQKAEILLTGSDLVIDDISYMLGYKNTSNFYKAFRGYYNMSPTEFRKK